MDLAKCRRLLAIDPNDALSQFTLGRKLAEVAGSAEAPDGTAALGEAADHLATARRLSPGHLATYHLLADVLIRLKRLDEAKEVLIVGIERAGQVTEGMGKDLAPLMRQMMESLVSASPAG